jgi:hypothetical protein
LREAFAESAEQTMVNLKSLVDPKFNEDDVTILLLKRMAGSASSGTPAKEIVRPESSSKDRGQGFGRGQLLVS